MKIVWGLFSNFAILMIIFLCLANSVENKKLQKSFEEIFGDGWHLKGMGEEGEEKEEEANLAQIMAQENDQQQKRSREGHSNHQMINGEGSTKNDGQNGEEENKKLRMNRKIRTNEEKLAIMRKYCELKRKDPKMSGRKIEKALKVSRESIRRWKGQFEGNELFRELEMDMKRQLIVANDRKRKIVGEFRTIKEQIKQKGWKYSAKQWDKIEKLLAKKLGTNRDYVYRWIRELGMTAKKNLFFSNEQKIEIIRTFRAIKEQIKQKGRKYSAKQWAKIEQLLAHKLGTNRKYVYKWCREFGMTVKKNLFISNEQMRKIVRAFRAIKEEIKQQKWKLSRKDWNEIESLLAQKLGTNRCKIYEWIKEFGKNQRKMKSNDAKLAIVGKYWKVKRKDPKMSAEKIGKALKIGRESIRRWKKHHIE